jgi:hypothetical protein
MGVVGLGVGVVVNEGLRNKVLDLLFGAEEEFEYTSATVAAAGAASVTPPVASVDGR